MSIAPEDDVRRGDGWMGWIGYTTPVRGEGTIDGRRWSFYARGNVWVLNIAGAPGEDPELIGVSIAGWSAEGRTPGKYDAGWMTEDEAWPLVEAAFADFRRGKLRRVLPGTPGF